MGDKTNIEWADATWNPIVGCSLVSPGCTNCYAMRHADRMRRMSPGSHYFGMTTIVNGKPVWTGKVASAPEAILTAPLHWRRPRRIFVNSMGDLFHEEVPDHHVDDVFATMALAHWHTYLVLTKRSARMRRYVSDPNVPRRITRAAERVGRNLPENHLAWPRGMGSWTTDQDAKVTPRWPLPRVWLGVSAEDQARADERIPDLLATPAAVRFVSAEPLLGPIDFTWIAEPDEEKDGVIDSLLGCNWIDGQGFGDKYRPVRPGHQGRIMTRQVCSSDAEILANKKLDWIIVGGESGPRARPMHPDWARAIRDQCAAAGVPFFFKQWGEWAPEAPGRRAAWESNRSRWHEWVDGDRNPTAAAIKVGKHSAGRLLDGVLHDTYPEVRA